MHACKVTTSIMIISTTKTEDIVDKKRVHDIFSLRLDDQDPKLKWHNWVEFYEAILLLRFSYPMRPSNIFQHALGSKAYWNAASTGGVSTLPVTTITHHHHHHKANASIFGKHLTPMLRLHHSFNGHSLLPSSSEPVVCRSSVWQWLSTILVVRRRYTNWVITGGKWQNILQARWTTLL